MFRSPKTFTWALVGQPLRLRSAAAPPRSPIPVPWRTASLTASGGRGPSCQPAILSVPSLTSSCCLFMPQRSSSTQATPPGLASSASLAIGTPTETNLSGLIPGVRLYSTAKETPPSSSSTPPSTNAATSEQDSEPSPPQKLGIVAQYKMMFKKYWYVLIPVHVATSIVWYGGFYFLCKSGVDMVAVLRWTGLVTEKYLESMQHSNMGYFAMAYGCYKVATPARYTVTVAGTTFSVRYLRKWGILKTSSQIGEGLKGHIKYYEFLKKLEEDWINAWRRFARRRK